MTIQEMYKSVRHFRPHTNPVDVKVAVESTCPKGHNMEYRGFRKVDSYRAFAICKLCNIAYEF